MYSRTALLAALFASALGTRVAHAKPTARLSHTRGVGAESCPDAEAMRRGIEERLGYHALRDDAARTVAVGFERDSAGAFAVRVSLTDERGAVSGERRLSDESSTCAAVADAAVLTVSVLLESVELAAPASPAASASEAAPASTVSQPVTPAAPRIVPRARLEGALGLAIAPAPAAGFLLAAGARYRAASVDVEGRVDLPAGDDFPVGRARTSLRIGNVVPCIHFGVVEGCAVVGVGALVAQGIDVTNARSDTALHVVAGLRAGVEVPLGQGLFLTAHGDGLFALTRTVVTVGGVELWATPPVGASIAGGIGYAFSD